MLETFCAVVSAFLNPQKMGIQGGTIAEKFLTCLKDVLRKLRVCAFDALDAVIHLALSCASLMTALVICLSCELLQVE